MMRAPILVQITSVAPGRLRTGEIQKFPVEPLPYPDESFGSRNTRDTVMALEYIDGNIRQAVNVHCERHPPGVPSRRLPLHRQSELDVRQEIERSQSEPSLGSIYFS